MSQDKETQAVVKEAKAIEALLTSEGWQIALDRLNGKIELIGNVSTIEFDNRSLDDIGKEAMIRASSIALVNDWLDEVKSIAEQYENNKELIDDGVLRS